MSDYPGTDSYVGARACDRSLIYQNTGGLSEALTALAALSAFHPPFTLGPSLTRQPHLHQAVAFCCSPSFVFFVHLGIFNIKPHPKKDVLLIQIPCNYGTKSISGRFDDGFSSRQILQHLGREAWGRRWCHQPSSALGFK